MTFRSSFAWFSLLSTVSILGCSDVESDRGLASAGASGASGNGGASGTAGSGGSSGAAGASGSSGSAGSSGTGGTAGSTPLDARLENCLRVNACEADGGTPVGVQICLGHDLDTPWTWASTGADLMAIQAMSCKLAAPDCAAVRACTPAAETYATQCSNNPGNGFCDGNVWVNCDALGMPIRALDCSAFGQLCGTDVWAGCGLEPCTFGETQASCDPQDPGILIECSAAGFLTRVDCRTQYNYVQVHKPSGDEKYSIAGEICGFDSMRSANACIGTGDPCDTFSQACNGDTLETCAGGKLAHRDCTTLSPEGQGCGFVQSGTFGGLAACGIVAGSCDLGAAETCSAGVISFCNYGQPGSIDCKTAGYSDCATSQLQGRAVAYCVH